MDVRLARMCLATVFEPGHALASAAVAEFGPQEVWEGLTKGGLDTPVAQRARRVDPDQVLAATQSTGQRFVIPGDSDWPSGLDDLSGCEPVQGLSGEPWGLWVRGGGDLAALGAAAVSVVGSRASTSYGDTVAADLAADLSEAGLAVISGGAYGIDAAAHRGGLAGRTPTIAVLACGLDELYPAGHRGLFERIGERGLLISELPPGEHPSRVRFLARNRLIAALSPVTVLVEAAARSGARNTVTWANVLQRMVAAVPGPVTSATSVTPHRLIRRAEAILVTRATEILELVSAPGTVPEPSGGGWRPTDQLEPHELRLFEAVPGRGSLPAGELALRAGLSISACLAVLDRLAELGFVDQDVNGEWRLPPRRPVEGVG